MLLTSKTLFVLLLVLIFAVILLSNCFEKEYATISYNILNLLITVPLVAVCLILLAKEGIRGDFGKGWICFTAFNVLWFVAERIWMVYDLVYKTDPWPSEADYFWLAGYPIYFAFAIFYLKPFQNAISTKLIAVSIGISATIAGFLMYNTAQESDIFELEVALGLAYPVADALSLAPIFVGLVLFFRGKVNFLWTCLLIGMLCFVVSDYGFSILSLDDEHYSGHPIDIPYLWAYLFFLFGAYNRFKLFTKQSQENRFNDQEKFR